MGGFDPIPPPRTSAWPPSLQRAQRRGRRSSSRRSSVLVEEELRPDPGVEKGGDVPEAFLARYRVYKTLLESM